jgi:branched-chain amino acid transport system ATP-binding protein
MSSPLLDVQHVTKRFGGFHALTDVSLQVHDGERVGLIGPNGSGKTTLINCIAGLLQTDGGRIRFRGTDITTCPAHQRTRLGIARTFQIPKPFTSMTVLGNLYIPLTYVRPRQGHSADIASEAVAILQRIGLEGKAHARVSSLPLIELRKLELARAMAARPLLLIADEALAGLSSVEVDEILDILARLNNEGVTMIMIEHIMRAVMRFSSRVVVLDAGQTIADGTPEETMRQSAVEKAYLGT